MSALTRYGAVIFDLDGTLADSMQVWDTVCREWAEQRGFNPPADLEQTIALMTLYQSAIYVIKLFGLTETPAEIQQQWNDLVARKYREAVKPKPGAVELIQALHAAGIPLAIATSGFAEACEGFLESNGIRHCFGAITYTHDTGKNKTHPEVYIAAAKALGVQPGSCAVAEDLPAALTGVRAAGMDFIAVHDPAVGEQWYSLARSADLAVKSLTELL